MSFKFTESERSKLESIIAPKIVAEGHIVSKEEQIDRIESIISERGDVEQEKVRQLFKSSTDNNDDGWMMCSMTKQQRQKLFEYMLQEHDVTLLDGDFAEISNIIHPPIFPFTVYTNTTDTAHIATTEPDRTDAWDIAQSILDKCNCAHIYISRKRIDPNCRWCEFHVDFIQAMRLFADQEVKKAVEAKDKEITELKEDIAVMEKYPEHWHFQYKIASEKLTAANQTIAEKEKEIAELKDMYQRKAVEFESMQLRSSMFERDLSFAETTRDNIQYLLTSAKSELTEANKCIAELEIQIDKITGSNPITLK